MAIVTSTYRYKRPPRKRKAVALEVPAIVRAGEKNADRGSFSASDAPSANEDRKPAIVTIRKHKHAALAHLLDGLTLEESNRRADLTDAMFQDMKRRIAEKDRL